MWVTLLFMNRKLEALEVLRRFYCPVGYLMWPLSRKPRAANFKSFTNYKNELQQNKKSHIVLNLCWPCLGWNHVQLESRNASVWAGQCSNLSVSGIMLLHRFMQISHMLEDCKYPFSVSLYSWWINYIRSLPFSFCGSNKHDIHIRDAMILAGLSFRDM